MSCQYEQLGKAELIELLQKTTVQRDLMSQKLEKAELTIKTQSQKIEKAELTIKNQTDKIQEQDRQIIAHISHIKSITHIASNFSKDANVILHEIDKSFNLYTEDAFTQDIVKTFKLLFQDCLTCVKNYSVAYSNSIYAPKGSDVGSSSTINSYKKPQSKEEANKAVEDIKSNLEKLHGSLKNQSSHFKKIKKWITIVHDYCIKNGLNENIKELDKILKVLNIKPKHSNKKQKDSVKKNGKKTAGRIKTENFKNVKNIDSNGCVKKCSTCHDENLVNMRTEVSKIISQSLDLRDAIEAVSQGNDIYVCKKCGNCEIAFDKDKDDFPVMPNRSIGMSLIRSICLFMYNGIPLDRYNSWLIKGFDLGHDTLPYNVSDYVAIYLNPLYEMIYQKAKSLNILLADETVFDCLHSQGKGNMNAQMKELKDTGQLDTNSKNYVLTLSSAPSSDIGLVYYRYINNRATDSLCNVITDDFAFEYLVSDAYPVYANICERIEGRKWQTCITHFRREVIKACNPRLYVKDLEVLDDKELREKLLTDFNSKKIKAPAAMLEIFYAISKIYEIESAYQYDSSLDINVFKKRKLENRAQIKNLFKQIDITIDTIKDDYVEQTRAGTYRAKLKASLYAKPIIYYLNHRQSFSTFIDNADVPPDSNHVECMIRRLAMIRSSVKQKVSEHNMQDLCKIVSIYKTLELNGIEPNAYLTRLNNCMYVHCVKKAMIRYYEENGELPKGQIKTWNMAKELEDFDYSEFTIFKS